MGFMDKAESAFGKATETAGRTGKYMKLKAQIADAERDRDKLIIKIGNLALADEEMASKLRASNNTLFMELEHINNELEELQAKHDEIKAEGLVADDDDEDDDDK
ncbi:MAG: hypothetical protein ACOYIK_09080 [Coriobacteriales bacterium]|jgi:seryl-tRNA synthetase